MKAILEFDLHEERLEFEQAVNGHKWVHVCWKMDQYLRSNTKHAPDSQPHEVYEALQKAREELRGFMSQQGVDFNE
jgi:hypothetical protein